MVVTRAFRWNPSVDETAARLGVPDAQRAAFAESLAQTVAKVKPSVRLRQLSIDAVGDAFVQLSGEWIDDARLAARLSDASQAWAFAVLDGMGAPAPEVPPPLLELALFDALSDAALVLQAEVGGRMDAVRVETDVATVSLLRLLDLRPSEAGGALLGVLYSVPDTGCGHGCQSGRVKHSGCNGCNKSCAACDATNTNG